MASKFGCDFDAFLCMFDAVEIDDRKKRLAAARKCIAKWRTCTKEAQKKESQRLVQINRSETAALDKKLKTIK